MELEWRNRRFRDAYKGLRVFGKHWSASFAGVPEALSRELRGHLEDIMEAMRKRHGNPWPMGTTSKTLATRSGHLLEYMADSIKVEGETIASLRGEISVPHDRKIHEHGGVLRPKRAKYLTVPLPAALDSRGVPLKKSARDWKDTFVLRSKAGNLLIVQKKGASIVPLYVLKKEVSIPPRLGMLDTARAGHGMLVDRMAAAALKTVRGNLKK